MPRPAPPAPQIRFGIVGSGWRSAFFLRIARALPERFAVTGLVTRSAETSRALEEEWGIRTFRTAAELLAAEAPAFVVVSVPRTAAPDVIADLVDRGVAVLTETPPGETVEDLERLDALVRQGARIEVAEQYPLSPLLAAQLAIAASGRLGRVSQVQVAQCHDYHGVRVMRRALGIGFEDATITAQRFSSPLVAGPDRDGDPVREEVVTAVQTTARFDFGDRLGVYDFADRQYFSWIRRNRLLVRGERGEIVDEHVSWLLDATTPTWADITRIETGQGGNLEGLYLRGLLLGSDWVYENPFAPGRLADDEIAIAQCLVEIHAHAAGGPSTNSLAEASQDHHLALLMHEAATTGKPVRSTRRAWAD
ncbi:Gfo/Idh/MocA family oxidoreductase [Clavibacter capsici]|uniref:Gfo/Idh/MocA family oxidoreductase n=1 Tax=Clavibacter capsici TaxID=1874630 RepID=UPI00293ED4D0|nr:Gfo/Idh/MocA family oxidoreductase [Clavibacter capsici]